MESIRALISALAPLDAAGVRLDAEAVAEALWLARTVTEGPAEQAEERAEPGRGGGSGPRERRTEGGYGAASAPYAVNAGTGEVDGGPGSAIGTIGVPRLPAVSRKPAVLSELRPLARRAPGPGTAVFDEERTVERTAATGVPWPVTRPELLRERDLCLVLDRDPTMAAWEGLAREVRELFEALGAFRRVEVWYAETDPDGRMLLAAHPLEPASRPIASLRDPSGRRIVLLLTAALGLAWTCGAAAEELSRLAEWAPVAVAQPLPAQLWPRTGLDWSYGRLTPKTPGAPSALKLAPSAPGYGADPAELAPVPVFELRRGWLGPWARTLTGDGSPARYPLLRRGARAVPAPDEPTGVDAQRAELGLDPQEWVRHFRSASSAEAYRLAVLLSVASLNPPVMRLIQRVMMPESDPSVLAEVIAGGLLEAVPDDAGVHERSEDHRAFAFRPQVVEVLRRGLRRSDSFDVHAATSEFIEDWLRVPTRVFLATLSVPAEGGGRGGVPFAYVRPAVLERVTAAFGTTEGVVDYGELAGFRDVDPTGADVRNLRALLTQGLRLLGAMPVGDRQREGVLSSVIDIMARLWTETSDPALLDEAIALGKASLAELTEPGPRAERMAAVVELLMHRYERTGEADLLVESLRLLDAALALDPADTSSAVRSARHERAGAISELLARHSREPADLLEAANHYAEAERAAENLAGRPILALREVLARLGVVQLRGTLGDLMENQILAGFRRACFEHSPGDRVFEELRDAVLRRAAELPLAEPHGQRLLAALHREADRSGPGARQGQSLSPYPAEFDQNEELWDDEGAGSGA